jgi:adenosylmethionine---8-amino-7-oxononanoate aminotransferase
VSAIQKQAEKLSTKLSLPAILTNRPKRLPRFFCKLHPLVSTTTSVEVALKMALGYWHNIGKQRMRTMHREDEMRRLF